MVQRYKNQPVHRVSKNDLRPPSEAARIHNILNAHEEALRSLPEDIFGLGSGTGGSSITVLKNLAVTSVSANYSASVDDELILCNGTLTVSLPTAIGNEGKRFDIKNIGSGTVTVSGFGSQTVDGNATLDITFQYSCMSIVSDDSNWNIV